MESVMLCAVGVGGATAIGALAGFIFRDAARRHSSNILAVAAGVMLAAAATNLIAPAVESRELSALLMAVAGLFVGAVVIHSSERLLPIEACDNESLRSALIFAIAMAIHNLPEGVAAGLSFGTGEIGDALMVTVGIALHNIPEGMIAIFPLLASGIRPAKAFLLALSGGVAEVIGTVIGYIGAEIAEPVMPFALAFAGGTMIYVVAGEMIPESQTRGRRRAAFGLILGYALMTVLNAAISR